MERAPILKRRLVQQRNYERQVADEALNRAAARIVRPLIEPELAALAKELGDSLQNVTALPSHKLQNDHHTIIIEHPIRDYLTTRAFRLAAIDAIFVISIAAEQMDFDVIVRRYRQRGRFEGTAADGVWLPPGAYTQTERLAAAGWAEEDEAPAAVAALFAQARQRLPQVRRLAATAAREVQRRRRAELSRQLLIGAATLIYLLVMAALLALCMISMYLMVRYGPGMGSLGG
jgi:hypothetical protein